MYFMLVCDIGDIVPMYEFRPVKKDDGQIPDGAIEAGYLRIDSRAFRPKRNADGTITPADQTPEYMEFAMEGVGHEYSPISTMTHFDEDDENEFGGYEDIESLQEASSELDTIIYGVRYFEDSAFFVAFESVEMMMEFMGKYNQDINYEIGREYPDGKWTDAPIPYIVIDVTLLGETK